jgi:uncharacterized DUF497 family protein
VAITYNPPKRKANLQKHGLDFEDAVEVFAGRTVLVPDLRQDYREDRYQTFGFLCGRMVVVVWTPRRGDQHIISMRKCNAREQTRHRERLGQARRHDR